MSLIIQVTKESITRAEPHTGYNVTFRLKCWPEGSDIVGNPQADPPVLPDPTAINQVVTVYHKTSVEGVSETDLFTRTRDAMLGRMQAIIDKYKLEQTLLGKAVVDQIVTSIQNKLTG